jgi:hypothetical protein
MQVSFTRSIRDLTLCAVVLAGAVACSVAPPVADQPDKKLPPITEADVNASQEAWCQGILEIGRLYRAGGDYRKYASDFIDRHYDYSQGKVFFKPTLTYAPHTFRPTKEGAFAYFVGGDSRFPPLDGFATKPWQTATYDNNAAPNGIQIHGEIAMTMGHVHFTDSTGTTTVDKTFVFRRFSDGRLRLIVHHSSLPFPPPPPGP